MADTTETPPPVVPDKPMTYAELKAVLDALTPDQLAQPVIWSGDERGGFVKYVWIAAEDWIGDSSDHETFMARSEVVAQGMEEDYEDAEVCIPAGTVHLTVD